MKSQASFFSNYGPWALIAGGSEGIGEAFARELARKGFNLILIARRLAVLNDLKEELENDFAIEVDVLSLDLAEENMLDTIDKTVQNKDVGLFIYNAAISPIGRFLDFSLEKHEQVIRVNCRGPLILSHYFGNKMKKQGRGGIILMSSLAGFQGTPLHIHYGATKAYNRILGEGLWYELKQSNIDVLVCNAGATETPNFLRSKPKKLGYFAPKPMKAEKVAKQALNRLGQNPNMVAGFANRLANFFLRTIIPHKLTIKIMGKTSKKMYGAKN